MYELLNPFLIIATIALLLMAVLVFEKAMRQGNRSKLYLVVLLFISAFYFTSYGLQCCTPSPYKELGSAFRIPLILTFIPLFFLFLRDLITGTDYKAADSFSHLLIPVVFLITAPILIIFPDKNVVMGGLGPDYTLFYLLGHLVLISQVVYYTLRMFRRYDRYTVKIQNYYESGNQNFIKIRWLLIIFIVYLIVIDNWIMSSLIPDRHFLLAYPAILFIVAFALGWVGYITPSHNKQKSLPVETDYAETETAGSEYAVKNEMRGAAALEIEPETDNGGIDTFEKKIPYEGRTPFDYAKKRELYEQMTAHFKENKAYTNSGLTLKQLARDLGTNTRYLSMVINEFECCNFNQMINRYRVNEVIQLLVENQAESYSYFGLAQKAGFHSKSVFISAFKAHTGSTPSEFTGSMKKLIQM